MSIAEQFVKYNGQMVKVKDIPDRFVRNMLGMGHPWSDDHDVVYLEGRTYKYTPQNCEMESLQGHTEWVLDGTILICIGCGLDCT